MTKNNIIPNNSLVRPTNSKFVTTKQKLFVNSNGIVAESYNTYVEAKQERN